MFGARGLWFTLVLSTGCDRVFGLELRDAGLRSEVRTDAPLDASLELCPPSYQSVTGGETRYRFPQRQTTWNDAQDDCADDSAPSITHLIELGTVGELVAIQTVFPVTAAWQAWTGYARDQRSDPYLFFSTTGLTFGLSEPSWAPGEPNADTQFGEETATFFSDDHEIYDGLSAGVIYFICECDGRLVTRTFDLLP